MSAAADDDEIISRLRLRLAPGLRPSLVAGEALLQESEGRIARAHARPRDRAEIRDMRVTRRIGAERVDFRFARGDAGEGLEIMRREIEPRLDRLLEVERVIADLHVVEHPRPHQRVLVLDSRIGRRGLERLCPDAIGTVEGLAHAGRAARPFPDGEIEPRAEDGRIDPAAKDVADGLIDGRRRLIRLATIERVLRRSQRSSRASRSSSRFLKYQ